MKFYFPNFQKQVRMKLGQNRTFLKFDMSYRKNPWISDTRKYAVITLKVEKDGFSLSIQKMQRELQTV